MTKDLPLLVAGLTGGIASGKSTVARMFHRAGAIIIDADRIARQVVTPGQSAWQAIQERFGPKVLRPDGTIDRGVLGALVFKDVLLRRQLEQIIHPHVRTYIDAQIAHLARTSPRAVVIQDVPLLLEAGLESNLAEVIVVYVPEPIQLQRLMQRDGFSLTDARARIQTQLPMEEKRRRATLVIDNSGSLSATEKQVLKVYTALADRAAKITPSTHVKERDGQ